jgi:ZIP family zinc transporter
MDLALIAPAFVDTLSDLGPALTYSGLPVLAAMVGSLFASRYQLGPHGRSHLQHLAAGIIFSVVAVEILPDMIHRQHPMLLTIGFSSGVAFMLWLETLSGASTLSEEENTLSRDLPWSLIAGVGIDVFLDGLLRNL